MQDQHKFFERPAASFSMNAQTISGILQDPANPLWQLAHSISNNSKVLDVGAGNGILALLLKELGKAVIIDGVEPDARARILAEPGYRLFYACGLDEYLEQTQDAPELYDLIVLADVLEHIAYPESLLSALKKRLTDEGRIAISIPNVAFANIRMSLLNGTFCYVDSGILERTHLRFYTLETIRELFSSVELFPVLQVNCIRNPLKMSPMLHALPFTPFVFWRMMKDPLSQVFQFFFLLKNNPGKLEIREAGNRRRNSVRKYISERRAFFARH